MADPTPGPTPSAPSQPPGAPAPAVPPVEPGPRKVQFRNILVLTMCGVVLVLIFLLISFFMGHAGDPKKDFRTDIQAPNYQTDPQDAPMKTAAWYLRRCQEAFKRKDYGACRMMLDDLHEQLQQRKDLLTPEQQLDLKDLEDDFAAATKPK